MALATSLRRHRRRPMGADSGQLGRFRRSDLLTVGIEQRLGEMPIPSRSRASPTRTGRKVDFDALLARKPTLLALVYYQLPQSLHPGAQWRDFLRSPTCAARWAMDSRSSWSASIRRKRRRWPRRKKTVYLRRYSRGEERVTAEWSFLVGDQHGTSINWPMAVGYRYRYRPRHPAPVRPRQRNHNARRCAGPRGRNISWGSNIRRWKSRRRCNWHKTAGLVRPCSNSCCFVTVIIR